MANISKIRNSRIHLHGASTVLAALLVLGLVVTPAAKAQVVAAGAFNLAGAIDITSSAFTFGSLVSPPPGDQMALTTLPLTGQFSDVSVRVDVPVKNLSAPTVTPGTPFLVSDWITLPNGIYLDLTNIAISSASHTCTFADDAPGSTCRATATSPITLEQGTDGVTALLNLSGVAYFQLFPEYRTRWMGKLAADFSGGTVSGVLDLFVTTGHFTTGYQANFVTVPPSPQQLAQDTIDAVNTLYSQGALNGGQDNSLVQELQQAINLMNAGKNAGAIENLNSFISEMNDLLSSGVLTPSQGNPLITAAQSVIGRLS